jgi:glutamyl-tRNA synthetase
MSVKVRFAPSPTGNLHIGSARTALFNYLYARHHGGKFVIRIEDTDKERSTKAFEEDVLNGLAWLGFSSDEPIVYQSQRNELHRQYIDKLLAKGMAYKDTESPAIYFKVPTEGETIVKDLVKGDISFQNKDFKDQVILKSDGSVTYNFAVVIDDALMGITHVIRGEDHISNTPKQIFFYEALEFSVPHFAHIPLILGPDRSKLSKRHGATSINEYRSQGYLAESINNYLALLGWSPADNQEVMTLAELCQKFDLDRASKSNAIFDVQKLKWINGQKIRHHNPEKIYEEIHEYLSPEFHAVYKSNKAKALFMIKSVRDNIEVITDIHEPLSVFFTRGNEKLTGDDNTKRVFGLFSGKIAALSFAQGDESNTAVKVQEIITQVVQESGLKKVQVLHPLRVALTGKSKGPNLKDIITILGKETVLERIHEAWC